jgi:signal peptidase I
MFSLRIWIMHNQTITPPPDRGIVADFCNAFPAVLGPRFWPRAGRLVGVIVLLAVLRSIVADWSTVASGSMIPTLLVGDRVLVNKLAYDLKVPFTTLHIARWRDPHRGDVIIFLAPTTGLRLVKRVIGVPGDLLEIRDNIIYLNGVAAECRRTSADASLPQDHTLLMERLGPFEVPHSMIESPKLSGRRTFTPTEISAGKYFVMGDNRDESFDSRYFGLVDRSQILGRTGCVLISLNPDCMPRWRRMLKSFP